MYIKKAISVFFFSFLFFVFIEMGAISGFRVQICVVGIRYRVRRQCSFTSSCSRIPQVLGFPLPGDTAENVVTCAYHELSFPAFSRAFAQLLCVFVAI